MKSQPRRPAASEPLKPPPELSLAIELLDVASLVPYTGNTRAHSKKQIAQIAASIREFGFNAPILLGDDNTIIAGHGRLEAAKLIGLKQVPTVRLSHLTAAQRRAYAIAENRLAELSTWDDELLSIELSNLSALDLGFDLELTGFDGADLDRLLNAAADADADEADRIPESEGPAVTKLGDVWQLGDHLLVCGDARDEGIYQQLLAGKLARMIFADGPYNVPIDGNVGGRGKIERRPFVMGCGEMSSEELIAFNTAWSRAAATVLIDGGLAYLCMDWGHLQELHAAASKTFDKYKQLIVWDKGSGGMGAFYRSQHELIAIYKKGKSAHLNTFGLGEGGRYRTNVWKYPGMNSFGKGRDEALQFHPTVKPVALVADAIKDVTKRGEIVLDPFGGSGTTLIAAQKTRRRARLIELDPLYCDVICRRWQAYTQEPAILQGEGRSFDDIAAERLGEEA